MGRYGNEIVEAGMVGAFEPLVYIPGRFGMQNKDMFCVTEKGCELLSDVTPTDTLVESGLMSRLDIGPPRGRGIRMMKITKIETIPIRLPTRRVHQWASLTTPIGVYVIIKLLHRRGLDRPGRSAGVEGLGRRSRQIFRRDAADDDAYHQRYSRAGVGRPGSRAASKSIHALMDKAVKGYPYCKAAIDAALYDVVGKALKVPAYQLLGGLFRERIPIAHSLGLMEIEKAVDEALQAKAEGVKTIKLKGGVDQQARRRAGQADSQSDRPGLEYLRRRQSRLSDGQGRGEDHQGDGRI